MVNQNEVLSVLQFVSVENQLKSITCITYFISFFTQCWESPAKEGDGIDNDCDGAIDEEIQDRKDNDGDGYIDEDTRLVMSTNDGKEKGFEIQLIIEEVKDAHWKAREVILTIGNILAISSICKGPSSSICLE